ncbi:MAG TPA: AI-2E family transporter [Puia sp.]|nr:AI-2E family transporter [Puia sp.]
MAENNSSAGNPGAIAKYLQIVLFTVVLLYLGRSLFIPLFFGLLAALLLYPVSHWLERRHWPRSLAISLLLSLLVLVFLALIGLLGMEMNTFIRDIPKISHRLAQLADTIQNWIERTYGMARDTQAGWIDKMMADAGNSVSATLRSLLNSTASTVIMLVMVPVYAALFLYHRGTFVQFVERLAGEELRPRIQLILRQSILSYFNYVKGTFFVYCIVGALNTIGLFALGIENALLYGMLTSFMMVIPYIGIFISASIPVSIALVTKDSAWYPVAVVAVFAFIQYLESNVIFPRVVGAQLNLSTWATLVAIVAGTLLWGLSGMILFTPFLAILKIVSDNIPEWQPLNILLSRSYGYKGKTAQPLLK